MLLLPAEGGAIHPWCTADHPDHRSHGSTRCSARPGPPGGRSTETIAGEGASRLAVIHAARMSGGWRLLGTQKHTSGYG